MDAFGARLAGAVARRGALCVGLDPHPGLLAQWGLSDDPGGLARFAAIFTEALADQVAVVKPQSAFFERFGSAGIAVLESIIRQLRDAGTLVILDVKRGDVGSTAAGYARAYLDPSSPMVVDAITASPFLGLGALRPMVDTALDNGRGLFVLALTSNPEGAVVQHARTADGRTVAQLLLDEIAQLNAGARPMGSIGAVVGATIGPTGHDFTSINGPILSPGLGAQGGSAADLAGLFGAALPLVLPSFSREVLRAGPEVDALRQAAARALAGCQAALAAGREREKSVILDPDVAERAAER